jgi:hypothetical protein
VQLIKSVFNSGKCLNFKSALKRQIIDRGSFDRKSVDRNCHFSVDQKFHNQLTKILDAFQLIKKFDQVK